MESTTLEIFVLVPILIFLKILIVLRKNSYSLARTSINIYPDIFPQLKFIINI